MNNTENYSSIEFSGLALHPGFSIYLIEIARGGKRFCYVGMTGDGHYPSARSILHRLAGHIDLGKQSTQSQLMKGIREQVFENKETLTKEDWASLQIKLHHWAIDGFEPWKGDLKKLNTFDPRYLDYQKKQKQVLALEQKIISDFGEILLNKRIRKADHTLDSKFLGIYEEIKTKVENG